jgi:hypothetical protein
MAVQQKAGTAPARPFKRRKSDLAAPEIRLLSREIISVQNSTPHHRQILFGF